MKDKRWKLMGTVLSILLFTWSCESYREQFNLDNLSTDFEISPAFAAPIAYGSFSIQDILESVTNDSSGFISQSEDSLIYVYYADTAFSLEVSSLITIPDNTGAETYFSSDVNIPAWLDIPIGNPYTFYKQERVEFNISEGDRVDSIIFKTGQLRIDAFSEFKHEGTLLITSDRFYDVNGDSLVLELPVSNVNGDFSSTTYLDLSDYKIKLQEENGIGVVIVNLNLTLYKSPAAILTSETAGINLSFQDMEYRTVYGFFAVKELTDIDQTIPIGFFDKLQNLPEIYFSDPNFNLKILNSIGIPISLDINTFRSRSAVSGEYVDLVYKDPDFMPFTVDAPTINSIGETVTTTRKFNTETTNIDEILSNIPDQLEISFSASTGNPEGSTEENFILDTSKIALEAEIYMPLWLSTSGYTLEQPLDIAFDQLLENLSMIESVDFRLNVTNEWPLGISLQIYFLNDEGTRIDSLWEEGSTALLTGAPVDENGELNRSELTAVPFNVTISAEKMAGLQDATSMEIKATAATTDNGSVSVKFYSSYLLKYKLSLDAKFKIDSSLL